MERPLHDVIVGNIAGAKIPTEEGFREELLVNDSMVSAMQDSQIITAVEELNRKFKR